MRGLSKELEVQRLKGITYNKKMIEEELDLGIGPFVDDDWSEKSFKCDLFDNESGDTSEEEEEEEGMLDKKKEEEDSLLILRLLLVSAVLYTAFQYLSVRLF